MLVKQLYTVSLIYLITSEGILPQLGFNSANLNDSNFYRRFNVSMRPKSIKISFHLTADVFNGFKTSGFLIIGHPHLSQKDGYYCGHFFTIQRIWLQFKEFELYWGAVFFLRSVHTFSLFLKSNWSSDFGHAETGNGAKMRVVLRREFFLL